MLAIELYAKIIELIKDQPYEETSMALEFVQRENSNKHYKSQINAANATGSLAVGQFEQRESYHAKQQQETFQLIKGAVVAALEEVTNKENKNGQA